MGHDLLPHDIVRLHGDVPRFGAPDGRVLTRRESAQLGHPVLNDEAASGDQVAGGIAEACDLFSLAEQIRDRIEDQIDQ